MEAVLSFVGGQFLSPLCQWIFDKVESCLQRKLNQNPEAMEKLEKWKILLPKIQAMLDKAEEQETAPDYVLTWHSHLKYLAYDMEDVLDEVEFQVKTPALSGASSSSTPPPSKRARTECSSLDLDSLLPKINDITIKLEQFESNANLLKSIWDSETGSLQQSTTSTGVRRRPETTSLPESHVYGREEERQAVLNHLLEREDDEHPHNVTVISLVGMGGIGKTTLARLLYNDDNVKKAEFHLKAWVCVSDDYDLQTLTKRILEAVAQQEVNVNSLDLLQMKLKDVLAGKKFLLVLDDVWNLNGQLWEILSKPFLHGSAGSKIIVTTRDRGVASVMTIQGYAIEPYILTTLSDNDCMQLFSMHVIQADNFDQYPDLQPMAGEIVRRCRGLPLAAKTLGGLLCGKRGRRDWEQILNSKIWDLPQEKSDVLPALRLSYYYLHSQLKRCFTYCALFPKDYEFEKDELVLYWMAEGFLKQTNGNMTMEKLGHQYFDELLSKGFLQPSNADVSKFVMHDLIHDLALSVDRNTCFHLPEGIEVDGSQATWDKVCHISFGCFQGGRHKYQKFEFLNKTKRLRTFIVLHFLRRISMNKICLSFRVLDELLPELKCLRVLYLGFSNIGSVPSGIGGMKHLRHLDLSRTQIRLIPESVTKLIFLQTLLAAWCENLTALPDGIGNLIDLHHLDIRDTMSLKDMPIGIQRLKNLQTLSRFMVSKEAGGLSLRHLKDLPNLRGELSIENLENVEVVQDAEEANLKTKKDLEQLIMKWYVPYERITSVEIINKQTQVLNHLNPHQHLEKITIDGYSGIETPSWMGDLSFFSNISFLKLCNCRNWASLPSIGRLPSLKELIIENMAAVQVIGVEFFCGKDIGVSCGSFKALEKLSFHRLPAWEVWSCDNGCGDGCHKMFPKLRELIIDDCPELRVSIGSLPSLEELEISGCREVIFKDTVDLSSLTSLTLEGVREQVNIAADESPQMFPKLSGLYIFECHYLTENIPGCNSTLRELIIVDCPELRVSIGSLPSLEELEIRGCREVIFKDTVDLNSLTSLTLQGVREQVNIAADESPQMFPKLSRLKISKCHYLTENIPSCNSTLRNLIINDCPKLGVSIGSLPSLEYLKIEGCREVIFKDTVDLSSLTYLIIKQVHERVSVVGEVCAQVGNGLIKVEVDTNSINLLMDGNGLKMGMQRLEHLSISRAPPFPDEVLHFNNNVRFLKELKIDGCESIESIYLGSLPGTIESIHIQGCSNLQGFHGAPPAALNTLLILDCDMLQSFPEGILGALKDLHVSGCRNLESLAGNTMFFTNLERLRLQNCENLKWLPDAFHQLASLKSLYIRGCPSIERFPEGGLPLNLEKLEVECVNMKQAMTEWGLDRLHTLKVFWVYHICPPDGLLLPPSLTLLEFCEVKKLKSISKDLLRNLTALKYLTFSNCRELSYFPKDVYLPPTLVTFVIEGCPHLGNKCGYKGEYLHLLADIPDLIIR